MTSFLALLRKQLVEARWMLGISSAALFAFGWLGVYFVAFGQRRIREREGEDPSEFLRRMGGDGDNVTAMVEMAFWLHPFVWLPVIAWAIGRGSLSVAGEVERGTMDLALSRPVRRSTYLMSQVATGTIGLLLLVGSLVAGNLIGTRFNAIQGSPTVAALLRPAINFVALGFCVFGYTLLFSSFDVVRWRSTLIGSSLTIAGFACWVIGTTVQALRGTAWETWLRRLSIFTAYKPVQAIGNAADLYQDLAILGGIGAAGVLLGLILFSRRDLPANG